MRKNSLVGIIIAVCNNAIGMTDVNYLELPVITVVTPAMSWKVSDPGERWLLRLHEKKTNESHVHGSTRY